MQKNTSKPRKFKHISWKNLGYDLYVEYYSKENIYFCKAWADYYNSRNAHQYTDVINENLAKSHYVWKSLEAIEEMIKNGECYEIFLNADECFIYDNEDL